MGKAFKAATMVGGITAAFFAVGAVTGPAGMAAASTYASTVGTGMVNTAQAGVGAVQWGAGLLPVAPT